MKCELTTRLQPRTQTSIIRAPQFYPTGTRPPSHPYSLLQAQLPSKCLALRLERHAVSQMSFTHATASGATGRTPALSPGSRDGDPIGESTRERCSGRGARDVAWTCRFTSGGTMTLGHSLWAAVQDGWGLVRDGDTGPRRVARAWLGGRRTYI